jgi:peptidoglycan-associated lipoprotein
MQTLRLLIIGFIFFATADASAQSRTHTSGAWTIYYVVNQIGLGQCGAEPIRRDASSLPNDVNFTLGIYESPIRNQSGIRQPTFAIWLASQAWKLPDDTNALVQFEFELPNREVKRVALPFSSQNLNDMRADVTIPTLDRTFVQFFDLFKSANSLTAILPNGGWFRISLSGSTNALKLLGRCFDLWSSAGWKTFTDGKTPGHIEQDIEAWNAIGNADASPDALKAYVEKFPTGIFLPLAIRGRSSAIASTANSPIPPSKALAQQANLNIGNSVFFDDGVNELSPPARLVVEKWAMWLTQNAGASAIVEGHADRSEDPKVADRRANSVKGLLIKLGIPSERIKTISFGFDRPTTYGSSANIPALNRRTVLVVN